MDNDIRPTQKQTDVNGIQTVFNQHVCPVPGMSGANATQVNGVDIAGGQAGSPRTMPEVNGVSVAGAGGGMKIPGS